MIQIAPSWSESIFLSGKIQWRIYQRSSEAIEHSVTLQIRWFAYWAAQSTLSGEGRTPPHGSVCSPSIGINDDSPWNELGHGSVEVEASQPDLEPAASTQILPETLKETRQVTLTKHTAAVQWYIDGIRW